MPKSGFDWTPNTEQVREAYVRASRNAFIASAGEHREEFNRWLTALMLPLDTIRAEYARFLEHHDTFELARAVGQIISEPVDVLPENERKTVERPDDING